MGVGLGQVSSSPPECSMGVESSGIMGGGPAHPKHPRIPGFQDWTHAQPASIGNHGIFILQIPDSWGFIILQVPIPSSGGFILLVIPIPNACGSGRFIPGILWGLFPGFPVIHSLDSPASFPAFPGFIPGITWGSFLTLPVFILSIPWVHSHHSLGSFPRFPVIHSLDGFPGFIPAIPWVYSRHSLGSFPGFPGFIPAIPRNSHR